MRSANQATLDLIKSFEGLKLNPYLDKVGVPTIGYGTILYPNGIKVSLHDPSITEEQAIEYLMHEVNAKAAGVEKYVTATVNDNEFGALVSFAYNLGLGSLHGSTLLSMLNANQDRNAIADQFLRWNKAGGKELPGLTRRRQAERALFLHPMLSANSSSDQQDIEVKLDDNEDDMK